MTAADAVSDTTVFFDAVLEPSRSLSTRGFRIFMIAMGLVGLLVAGFFVSLGAWPVFGFMGLDILIIYLMLKAHGRHLQRYETLRLTEDRLIVRHVEPDGRARETALEPNWLNVEMDDPPRHESQLTLVSRGRRLIVGAFLTPAERLEVARALREALNTWRQPPHLRRPLQA